MVKIIAEIGQNHEGDIDALRFLVSTAVFAGADIIKLQYWNVDNVYYESDTRYKSAKSREIPFDVIIETAEFIKRKGIIPMISFFGATESQRQRVISDDTLYLKYASSEYDQLVVDSHEYDFEKLACSGNKKIFFSTGYRKRMSIGGVILLACRAQYPAISCRDEIAHMMQIKDEHGVAGYSDHTIGIDAAKAAILMGADYIEKHFTLHTLKIKSTFRDHIGSMTALELQELKRFSVEHDANTVDPDYVSYDASRHRRLKQW